MGKVKIGIYFCVTVDILTKVLQKCSWSSPLPTIWILSKSLILIGCHANRKAKFSKKILKHLLLRSHKGMKLELSRHVHDISLYIIMFFIVVAHVVSLLWQLIMVKVEIGIYFYVTPDILTKKFDRNVPGVVLYQPYECWQNHWFWYRKAKFSKKNIQKSSSQKS